MTSLSQNPFSRHTSAADIKSPIVSLSFSSNSTEVPVQNLSAGNKIEYFVPQNVPIEKVCIVSFSEAWLHFAENTRRKVATIKVQTKTYFYYIRVHLQIPEIIS